MSDGRGALPVRGRSFVRRAGGLTKANVGISNENEGENPSHRKTKDSTAMAINGGLVGT